MKTTIEEIKEWIKRGKKEKATHLIVVCDTFEYEDYPVYVYEKDDYNEIRNKYDGNNMQRIMQIYDLKNIIKL